METLEIPSTSSPFKGTSFKEQMDAAESVIVRELPQENCPISHSFLPGLYIRTIFMRAGLDYECNSSHGTPVFHS